MESLYVNSILEDLKQGIKNSEEKADISIISLLENDSNVKVTFPAIFINLSKEYVTDINEKNYTVVLSDGDSLKKEFDYRESMPAQIGVSFICRSKDLNDLVEMETIIEDYYSSRKELSIQPPNMDDVRVPFFIALDSEKKPVRRKLQNKILDDFSKDDFFGQFINSNQEPSGYETTFFAQGEIVPWFFSKIHPAQLELDKKIEFDVFYRGAALEVIKTKLQDLGDDSSVIKDKINSIDTALNELREALNDYPPVDSFLDVFNVMTKKHLAAKKAIGIAISEKKESERKNLSSWKDDPTIMKYTDAIINDIRMKFPGNINFFGGSKYTNSQIICPMLAFFVSIGYGLYHTIPFGKGTISERCNTDFNLKYKKEAEDGTISSHTFTLNAVPCLYKMNVFIYDSTEDGVNLIIKKLVDLYGGQPIEMRVPDSRVKGEYILFNFSISQTRNPVTQDGKSFFSKLESDVFIFPYDIHGYSKEDIAGNTRIQSRILQQIEFCYNCIQILTRRTGDISSVYEAAMKGRPYLLGDGKTLSIADTKKLKDFIMYGTPIDRELFNSAFGDIIKVYSELYENIKDKWSLDQIKSNVEGYKTYFEGRKNRLFDSLSIPDHVDVNVKTIGTPYSDNPRTRKGVEHFLYCIQKDNQTLEEAVKDYPSYIEYNVERYREEERIRSEQKAARRESIGEFLKGSATVATGVTIGNTLTGNTGRGSNSAPGKANARCRVSCPNYKNGKCTVGSHPSMCQNSW